MTFISFIDRQILRSFTLNTLPLELFFSYGNLNGLQFYASRRYLIYHGAFTKVTYNGEELDYGEDPRAFIFEDAPAFVAAVYMEGYGFRNHLFRVANGRADRSILLIPQHVTVGKNWSPFTFADGVLGFIHSFNPLIVLKEKRREMGAFVLSAERGAGDFIEEGPGGFPTHRGGSCGLLHEGLIFGIGHTTRFLPGAVHAFSEILGFDHLRHRPFGWVLDPATMICRKFEIEGPFPVEFDVIDPTSLVRRGPDEFRVFTCEVNRHYRDLEGRGEISSYTFHLPTGFLSNLLV